MKNLSGLPSDPSVPAPTARRSQVRFLTDVPAKADAFGSRACVARAMADVVAGHAGGRAIGLEGGWGTGKSTIVEMFRGHVDSIDGLDVGVVTFDAWAHRGDPLRRTFIAECFRDMYEREWIGQDQKKTLEGAVDDLAVAEHLEPPAAARTSTSDRVVVLISLLFAPLGLALLSSGIEECMWLSVPLVAIPFAVYAAAWVGYGLGRLASGWRSHLKDENSWWGKRLDGFASRHHTPPEERFWPSGGSLEEQHAVGMNMRDRTSVEFRAAFERIAACGLERPERRLVIVIDNLDRLDPKEVLDAWSAMRLFVELKSRAGSADDWRSRVWLLVPYDPEGLRSLVGGGDAAPASRESDESRKSAAGESIRAAESFIDKTFHIRFEAPPLLLTDWRGYFKKLVRDAMPYFGREETQVENAYRVAALGFASVGRSPTPRELLLMVNDIAAIVMSRGDDDTVLLEHIACYVWLRRAAGSSDHVRRRLLDDGGVGEVFDPVLGEHGVIEVAQVLFGTADRAKAAELLLRQPLQAALADGDHERLTELSHGRRSGRRWNSSSGASRTSRPSSRGTRWSRSTRPTSLPWDPPAA